VVASQDGADHEHRGHRRPAGGAAKMASDSMGTGIVSSARTNAAASAADVASAMITAGAVYPCWSTNWAEQIKIIASAAPRTCLSCIR
jgi:hypothetical protein